MDTQQMLAVAGAACGTLGSIITAFSVSHVIRELEFSRQANEETVKMMARNQGDIPIFTGFGDRMKRAVKSDSRKLYLGVLLLAAGFILQAGATLVLPVKTAETIPAPSLKSKPLDAAAPATMPKTPASATLPAMSPAPTDIRAAIRDTRDNEVDWAGTAPLFSVQRRIQTATRWGSWETIDSKDPMHSFVDGNPPINTDTEYRVGSWSDPQNPPSDSQWSDPSSVVNNPGP